MKHRSRRLASNVRYLPFWDLFCSTCNQKLQICTRCGRTFCDDCDQTVHNTQPPLCQECYFHPQTGSPPLTA